MQQCPSDFQHGEYVFAARWADADWNDPWGVGFIETLGNNYVTLAQQNGAPIPGIGNRCFRFAQRITAAQGEKICTQYPPLEGTPFDAVHAQDIRGEWEGE